ncbi:MAG: McrC family protein [Campylobacterales bacterium]|nr:McrC family protein [Campylobacterales bacterium]
MKQITISEYGYLGCDGVSTEGNKFIGDRSLTHDEFQELKEYWESDKETFKIFTLENSKCLKATNYVGVVQTSMVCIEILPKIYDKDDKEISGYKSAEEKYRDVFLQMLKPLLGINEILIDKANLDVTNDTNIFEVFIAMFVNEMDKLIHKGVKSDYIAKEENQFFLKGKLKFNEHIKQNYIHKERFYVEFDEYLPDRVENRLLKSTINMLLKHTNDYDNKKALRQQLFIFDEVSYSTSYEVDFKNVNLHRGMEHYELPMRFAEVFLCNNSFSSIRGNDNVFSMLFPMEKVFEEYMEYVLENSKDNLGIKHIHINGLKGDWLLGKGKCYMINQQPDYLLRMNNNIYIVADAKWKLLNLIEDVSKDCQKLSFNAGDVYQMFSYLNYYENVCDTAIIFAPKTKEFFEEKIFEYLKQNNEPIGKKLKVIPIDLGTITKDDMMTKEINDTLCR